VRVAWLSLLLMVFGSGCASVGLFQSPETLGRKNWELAAELTSQAQANLAPPDALSVYPMGAVAFRYGLVDRVDLGVKYGPGGFELGTKVMLTGREGVVVSIAPSVAGTLWVPSGLLVGTAQVSVPVFIGVPLSQRVQLVFAPRVHDSVYGLNAGQAGGTLNMLMLGGAVGVVVRLGRFKIIPDVGVLGPPLATTTWRSDLPTGTVWGQGKWTFQFNVTLTLGKAT